MPARTSGSSWPRRASSRARRARASTQRQARVRPSLLLLALLPLCRRLIRRPSSPSRLTRRPTDRSPSRSSCRRSRTTSLHPGSGRHRPIDGSSFARQLLGSVAGLVSHTRARPRPTNRISSVETTKETTGKLAAPRKKKKGPFLCARPVLADCCKMKHDNGSFFRHRPKRERKQWSRGCHGAQANERHDERGRNKKGTRGCASAVVR